MKNNNISRAISILAQSRKIMITTHVNPDGDGVSSELALYLFLKKCGKEVAVVNRDPIPEIFAFLPAADKIHVGEQLPMEPDLIIVLDCGGLDRTGLKLEGGGPYKVVVIDHHLTNDHTGEINLLDPEASAAGELVYYLIQEMEKEGQAEMDHAIALCLYTSIFTDTGSFRYSNTSPQAMAVASRLLSYGVNSWNVAEHVYESKSYATLKLMGFFLNTLGISRKGRFAWGTIRREYMRQTGAREEHTDGFVNYPRSIKGVDVAILFRETDGGTIKISMRSKGKVNVAAIAEQFGGGGHHNAAGCIMNGTLKDVQSRLLQVVSESLRDEVPVGYGAEAVGKGDV